MQDERREAERREGAYITSAFNAGDGKIWLCGRNTQRDIAPEELSPLLKLLGQGLPGDAGPAEIEAYANAVEHTLAALDLAEKALGLLRQVNGVTRGASVAPQT